MFANYLEQWGIESLFSCQKKLTVQTRPGKQLFFKSPLEVIHHEENHRHLNCRK
jgi:hypothetical protein